MSNGKQGCAARFAYRAAENGDPCSPNDRNDSGCDHRPVPLTRGRRPEQGDPCSCQGAWGTDVTQQLMVTPGLVMAVDVAAYLLEVKGATGVRDGNSTTGLLPPLRGIQLLSGASAGLTWALVVACGAMLQPAAANPTSLLAEQTLCLETGSGVSGQGSAGGLVQQRALLQDSGGGGGGSNAVQLSGGALAGVVIGAVAFGFVASWLAALLLRTACFEATERLLACLPSGLAKRLRKHVSGSGCGGGSSHRRGSDGSGGSGGSSSRGGEGSAARDCGSRGGAAAVEVGAGSGGVEMVGAARALAAGLGLGLRRGSPSVRKRAVAPGCCQELFGREVTLVATDVEGSTELWEWNASVMNAALAQHDRLVRATMAACCGYEVATEGDAFLVAFHEAADAARWCIMLQSALLQVPWPPELLEHPRCRPRPLVPVGLPAGPSPAPSPRHAARPSAASSTPRHGITAAAATTATTPPQPHLPPTSVAAADQLLVLFRGLSVRCGVATGVPATIREHPLTRRMQYTGTLLRLATSIADSGSGGQVLVEPLTFKALHRCLDSLAVAEAELAALLSAALSPAPGTPNGTSSLNGSPDTRSLPLPLRRAHAAQAQALHPAAHSQPLSTLRRPAASPRHSRGPHPAPARPSTVPELTDAAAGDTRLEGAAAAARASAPGRSASTHPATAGSAAGGATGAGLVGDAPGAAAVGEPTSSRPSATPSLTGGGGGLGRAEDAPGAGEARQRTSKPTGAAAQARPASGRLGGASAAAAAAAVTSAGDGRAVPEPGASSGATGAHAPSLQSPGSSSAQTHPPLYSFTGTAVAGFSQDSGGGGPSGSNSQQHLYQAAYHIHSHSFAQQQQLQHHHQQQQQQQLSQPPTGYPQVPPSFQQLAALQVQAQTQLQIAQVQAMLAYGGAYASQLAGQAPYRHMGSSGPAAGSSAPIGGPHPPLLASPASAPGGPYPSGGGGGPFLLPPPPPPPPPSALLGLYAKATAMEAPNAEAGGPTGSPHKQGDDGAVGHHHSPHQLLHSQGLSAPAGGGGPPPPAATPSLSRLPTLPEVAELNSMLTSDPPASPSSLLSQARRSMDAARALQLQQHQQQQQLLSSTHSQDPLHSSLLLSSGSMVVRGGVAVASDSGAVHPASSAASAAASSSGGGGSHTARGLLLGQRGSGPSSHPQDRQAAGAAAGSAADGRRSPTAASSIGNASGRRAWQQQEQHGSSSEGLAAMLLDAPEASPQADHRPQGHQSQHEAGSAGGQQGHLVTSPRVDGTSGPLARGRMKRASTGSLAGDSAHTSAPGSASASAWVAERQSASSGGGAGGGGGRRRSGSGSTGAQRAALAEDARAAVPAAAAAVAAAAAPLGTVLEVEGLASGEATGTADTAAVSNLPASNANPFPGQEQQQQHKGQAAAAAVSGTQSAASLSGTAHTPHSPQPSQQPSPPPPTAAAALAPRAPAHLTASSTATTLSSLATAEALPLTDPPSRMPSRQQSLRHSEAQPKRQYAAQLPHQQEREPVPHSHSHSSPGLVTAASNSGATPGSAVGNSGSGSTTSLPSFALGTQAALAAAASSPAAAAASPKGHGKNDDPSGEASGDVVAGTAGATGPSRELLARRGVGPSATRPDQRTPRAFQTQPVQEERQLQQRQQPEPGEEPGDEGDELVQSLPPPATLHRRPFAPPSSGKGVAASDVTVPPPAHAQPPGQQPPTAPASGPPTDPRTALPHPSSSTAAAALAAASQAPFALPPDPHSATLHTAIAAAAAQAMFAAAAAARASVGSSGGSTAEAFTSGAAAASGTCIVVSVTGGFGTLDSSSSTLGRTGERQRLMAGGEASGGTSGVQRPGSLRALAPLLLATADDLVASASEASSPASPSVALHSPGNSSRRNVQPSALTAALRASSTGVAPAAAPTSGTAATASSTTGSALVAARALLGGLAAQLPHHHHHHPLSPPVAAAGDADTAPAGTSSSSTIAPVPAQPAVPGGSPLSRSSASHAAPAPAGAAVDGAPARVGRGTLAAADPALQPEQQQQQQQVRPRGPGPVAEGTGDPGGPDDRRAYDPAALDAAGSAAAGAVAAAGAAVAAGFVREADVGLWHGDTAILPAAAVVDVAASRQTEDAPEPHQLLHGHNDTLSAGVPATFAIHTPPALTGIPDSLLLSRPSSVASTQHGRLRAGGILGLVADVVGGATTAFSEQTAQQQHDPTQPPYDGSHEQEPHHQQQQQRRWQEEGVPQPDGRGPPGVAVGPDAAGNDGASDSVPGSSSNGGGGGGITTSRSPQSVSVPVSAIAATGLSPTFGQQSPLQAAGEDGTSAPAYAAYAQLQPPHSFALPRPHLPVHDSLATLATPQGGFGHAAQPHPRDAAPLLLRAPAAQAAPAPAAWAGPSVPPPVLRSRSRIGMAAMAMASGPAHAGGPGAGAPAPQQPGDAPGPLQPGHVSAGHGHLDNVAAAGGVPWVAGHVPSQAMLQQQLAAAAALGRGPYAAHAEESTFGRRSLSVEDNLTYGNAPEAGLMMPGSCHPPPLHALVAAGAAAPTPAPLLRRPRSQQQVQFQLPAQPHPHPHQRQQEQLMQARSTHLTSLRSGSASSGTGGVGAGSPLAASPPAAVLHMAAARRRRSLRRSATFSPMDMQYKLRAKSDAIYSAATSPTHIRALLGAAAATWSMSGGEAEGWPAAGGGGSGSGTDGGVTQMSVLGPGPAGFAGPAPHRRAMRRLRTALPTVHSNTTLQMADDSRRHRSGQGQGASEGSGPRRSADSGSGSEGTGDSGGGSRGSGEQAGGVPVPPGAVAFSLSHHNSSDGNASPASPSGLDSWLPVTSGSSNVGSAAVNALGQGGAGSGEAAAGAATAQPIPTQPPDSLGAVLTASFGSSGGGVPLLASAPTSTYAAAGVAVGSAGHHSQGQGQGQAYGGGVRLSRARHRLAANSRGRKQLGPAVIGVHSGEGRAGREGSVSTEDGEESAEDEESGEEQAEEAGSQPQGHAIRGPMAATVGHGALGPLAWASRVRMGSGVALPMPGGAGSGAGTDTYTGSSSNALHSAGVTSGTVHQSSGSNAAAPGHGAGGSEHIGTLSGPAPGAAAGVAVGAAAQRSSYYGPARPPSAAGSTAAASGQRPSAHFPPQPLPGHYQQHHHHHQADWRRSSGSGRSSGGPTPLAAPAALPAAAAAAAAAVAPPGGAWQRRSASGSGSGTRHTAGQPPHGAPAADARTSDGGAAGMLPPSPLRRSSGFSSSFYPYAGQGPVPHLSQYYGSSVQGQQPPVLQQAHGGSFMYGHSSTPYGSMYGWAGPGSVGPGVGYAGSATTNSSGMVVMMGPQGPAASASAAAGGGGSTGAGLMLGGGTGSAVYPFAYNPVFDGRSSGGTFGRRSMFSTPSTSVPATDGWPMAWLYGSGMWPYAAAYGSVAGAPSGGGASGAGQGQGHGLMLGPSRSFRQGGGAGPGAGSAMWSAGPSPGLSAGSGGVGAYMPVAYAGAGGGAGGGGGGASGSYYSASVPGSGSFMGLAAAALAAGLGGPGGGTGGTGTGSGATGGSAGSGIPPGQLAWPPGAAHPAALPPPGLYGLQGPLAGGIGGLHGVVGAPVLDVDVGGRLDPERCNPAAKEAREIAESYSTLMIRARAPRVSMPGTMPPPSAAATAPPPPPPGSATAGSAAQSVTVSRSDLLPRESGNGNDAHAATLRQQPGFRGSANGAGPSSIEFQVSPGAAAIASSGGGGGGLALLQSLRQASQALLDPIRRAMSAKHMHLLPPPPPSATTGESTATGMLPASGHTPRIRAAATDAGYARQSVDGSSGAVGSVVPSRLMATHTAALSHYARSAAGGGATDYGGSGPFDASGPYDIDTPDPEAAAAAAAAAATAAATSGTAAAGGLDGCEAGRSHITVVVVDMGVHRLKMLSAEIHELYHGVQLVQLLPSHLRSRAAYLPPLGTQAQLSMGYLDAPGAARALYPAPCPAAPLPLPSVALVFIKPEGYGTLCSASQMVAEASLAVFNAVVRDVLAACGVYECQEYEGTFMLAAPSTRAAVEAALALQDWLMAADWPTDLLDFDACREEHSPGGTLLFRGMRPKIGIYDGVPLSVVPHATTGRADYFGAVVNRAARLMAVAQGGQVLLPRNNAAQLAEEWRAEAAEQQHWYERAGSLNDLASGVSSNITTLRLSRNPSSIHSNVALMMAAAPSSTLGTHSAHLPSGHTSGHIPAVPTGAAAATAPSGGQVYGSVHGGHSHVAGGVGGSGTYPATVGPGGARSGAVVPSGISGDPGTNCSTVGSSAGATVYGGHVGGEGSNAEVAGLPLGTMAVGNRSREFSSHAEYLQQQQQLFHQQHLQQQQQLLAQQHGQQQLLLQGGSGTGTGSSAPGSHVPHSGMSSRPPTGSGSTAVLGPAHEGATAAAGSGRPPHRRSGQNMSAALPLPPQQQPAVQQPQRDASPFAAAAADAAAAGAQAPSNPPPHSPPPHPPAQLLTTGGGASASSVVLRPIGAATNLIMAAARQAMVEVVEEVDVIDLGDFRLKGLPMVQGVAAVQLRRLAARLFRPMAALGDKAALVRVGAGKTDTAPVRLLLPHHTQQQLGGASTRPPGGARAGS